MNTLTLTVGPAALEAIKKKIAPFLKETSPCSGKIVATFAGIEGSYEYDTKSGQLTVTITKGDAGLIREQMAIAIRTVEPHD